MSDAEHDAGLVTTLIDQERTLPRLLEEPAPGGPLQVEIVGGPMDGERCRVSKEIVTLGRAPGNDLVIPLDPRVSARHARVLRDGNRFWLEDLGSTNGTYLGDERVVGRTPIGPGTTFVVGATSVEFLPG